VRYLQDSQSVAIFLDGQLNFQAALPGAMLDDDGCLIFGQGFLSTVTSNRLMIDVVQTSICNSFDPSGAFIGEIDEITLWSGQRTNEQIIESMNHKYTGQEQNLTAYYSFDTCINGTAEQNIASTGSALDGVIPDGSQFPIRTYTLGMS